MVRHINLLRNAELFSKLKDPELEIVSKYCCFRQFNEGDPIFHEGENDEELYIVESGEVVITKKLSDDSSSELARFVPGDCFGELDLLRNSQRTATAHAARNSELLMFPAEGESFQDILENHPVVCAHILHKFLGLVASRIRSTNSLISKKTPWIKTLRNQVLLDKLTGIYNRSYFDDELALIPNQSKEKAAVVIFKPDNFKYLNDEFGHHAGDVALRRIADMLSETISEIGTVARFRGNELAVILKTMDKSVVREIAQKVLENLKRIDYSDLTGGLNVTVTGSAGISCFPIDGSDICAVVDKAHERVFAARERGGDCIVD
jgi:diguanylate cyclase